MTRLRILLGLVIFLSAGCSKGVPFDLKSDEPLKSATLSLRDQRISMEKGADGVYVAHWAGGEADGTIQVIFPDGGVASCRVGYVTDGLGPQKFMLEHRRCSQLPETV